MTAMGWKWMQHQARKFRPGFISEQLVHTPSIWDKCTFSKTVTANLCLLSRASKYAVTNPAIPDPTMAIFFTLFRSILAKVCACETGEMVCERKIISQTLEMLNAEEKLAKESKCDHAIRKNMTNALQEANEGDLVHERDRTPGNQTRPVR